MLQNNLLGNIYKGSKQWQHRTLNISTSKTIFHFSKIFVVYSISHVKLLFCCNSKSTKLFWRKKMCMQIDGTLTLCQNTYKYPHQFPLSQEPSGFGDSNYVGLFSGGKNTCISQRTKDIYRISFTCYLLSNLHIRL